MTPTMSAMEQAKAAYQIGKLHGASGERADESKYRDVVTLTAYRRGLRYGQQVREKELKVRTA